MVGSNDVEKRANDGIGRIRNVEFRKGILPILTTHETHKDE